MATHAEPGPGLVGRARELELLRRLVEDPAQRPGLLQVVGEPGIGKTTLLDALDALATERGHRVLRGAARELGATPHALVAEALEDSLELTDALSEEEVRELAGLSVETPSSTGMPTARYRLHRAVVHHLETLAAEQPVLLALDDLQSADPASLELVRHIVRRPPDAPVLLAFAYRPGLPSEVEAALDAGGRRLGGEHIELRPLEEEEAATLLPEHLGSEVRERIYRDSGGNPLYLAEFARVAALAPTGADRDGAPRPIEVAVADELRTHSSQSRALAYAAATLGDPFELELTIEAAGLDRAQGVTALEELLASDLVREDAPNRYRFRHPVVRRAVYDTMAATDKLDTHRRAAEALERRGAPPSVLAPHLERSAPAGDEHAAGVLAEAGRAALARAPDAAAHWLRASLRLLPQRERERELLPQLAQALVATGQLEEGRRALSELLALLEAPSPLRTKVAALSALVDHLLDNHREARALLLAARSEIPHEGCPLERAEVLLELAYGCFFDARWEEMASWAGDALAIEHDDVSLEASGEAISALAAYGLRDVEAARAAAKRATRLIDDLPDGQIAGRLEATCWLGWAQYCTGDAEDAVRHVRRGLAVSEATGQEHLLAPMRIVAAMATLALGRVAEAQRLAEEAHESALLTRTDLFACWALTLRCMAELQAGTSDQAVAFGRQAREAGSQSQSPWAAVATTYLAEAELENGDARSARELLLDPAGEPRLAPFAFYHSYAYEILTRAALSLERPSEAASWAERATELAEELGLDAQLADARRAQATLALDRDEADAPALALDAADLAESARLPVPEARGRLLAARALAQEGERTRALEELRRASHTLSGCGATRYEQHASAQLSALRREAAEHGDLAKLSRRERQVARLVAAGHTNRTIADELGLSDKTVESHMDRIFKRLGIHRRADLGERVEQARALQEP